MADRASAAGHPSARESASCALPRKFPSKPCASSAGHRAGDAGRPRAPRRATWWCPRTPRDRSFARWPTAPRLSRSGPSKIRLAGEGGRRRGRNRAGSTSRDSGIGRFSRRWRGSLGIHPLAMADVVHVPQRPKAELYDERLLIVLQMARVSEAGHVEIEQVSLVLGPNWVATFQESPGDVFDPVRARIRSGVTRIRTMGADYLAYALIDAVVDGYFPVVEALADVIDALEEEVVESPTRACLARIHATRRTLLTLHRVQWRQRDAISTLAAGRRVPVQRERAALSPRRPRPRVPDPGCDRDPSGHGGGSDGPAPLERQQSPERGDEDAHDRGHDLHPADLPRRRLRDELPLHAGATVALGLPGRVGRDGGSWRVGLLGWFRLRGWIGRSSADGETDDDEDRFRGGDR